MMPPGSELDFSSDTIRCLSCGAQVPDSEGPVHKYMSSSPGCWAIYGEVLAREFSDYRYGRYHRLTADAYAVQHPGQPASQTIQSIAVHLTGLYLVLDRGMTLEKSTSLMQQLTRYKSTFHWLEPPATMGAITVHDVWLADNPETHLQLVQQWAASAWSAWKEHHGQIKDWIDQIGSG